MPKSTQDHPAPLHLGNRATIPPPPTALAEPLTEAVTRTIPILHDPRVCVLCRRMNAPRVGVALTPDPVIVTDDAHPACRRVLAPGTPLCTPCYRATETV